MECYILLPSSLHFVEGLFHNEDKQILVKNIGYVLSTNSQEIWKCHVDELDTAHISSHSFQTAPTVQPADADDPHI